MGPGSSPITIANPATRVSLRRRCVTRDIDFKRFVIVVSPQLKLQKQGTVESVACYFDE